MLRSLRHFLTVLLFLLMNQVFATNLRGIEQELSDSVITTKITAKYTKNNNLNPLKITVSTQDGIVTLSGHVKDKQAFMEAVRLAKVTRGVKVVDTEHLEIKPVNTAFTDAYITAKVETAVLKAKVMDDESIPLAGINAKTTNGIVTLHGNVNSNASIVAILKRVNAIQGVKKIISYLQVSPDLPVK